MLQATLPSIQANQRSPPPSAVPIENVLFPVLHISNSQTPTLFGSLAEAEPIHIEKRGVSGVQAKSGDDAKQSIRSKGHF